MAPTTLFATNVLCRCGSPHRVLPVSRRPSILQLNPLFVSGWKGRSQAQPRRRLIATVGQVGRASTWSLSARAGNPWLAPSGGSEVRRCPGYSSSELLCVGGDSALLLYSIMDACRIHDLRTALGRLDGCLCRRKRRATAPTIALAESGRDQQRGRLTMKPQLW